ncbi:MAG: NADH-quinone oxidoreductase subunit M [Gammaproteobacteria bacterium]|jgi:NADH-quinone oxidoreductase subunit M|nr:NADH-quinone oxidoreductase subunit M [Gammaproteobacteria bacterium]
MILVWLMLILFVGGIAAWLSESRGSDVPRVIALVAILLDLALVILMLVAPEILGLTSIDNGHGEWLVLFEADWIPRFGISFIFGVDGLSLLLIGLTVFLGVISIGSAWHEIKERSGFFYFNLLWTLAGVIGVFTALDLFLFFFFWEVMLIPMYFIIAIWGHENKEYAAMKFFIFTQVSGLIMLLSILVLVFFNYQTNGVLTFSYFELLGNGLAGEIGMLVMLGFFIAFATKLPAVPIHNWLPDAHSQAPTAGSVILAGILLKTGAYGLIRFTVPLFPEPSQVFTPIAMTLGVVSILYTAKVAFAQTDLKRLIAYTSVSHMGFVLLGVYSWNAQALQGAIMTMLAHGFSAAALFMLAGGLQHRIHTRDMDKMGGLWSVAPKMSFMALFFTVAAVGMPGLGNFIGEFLVLLGSFQVSVTTTAFAALGLVVAAVYSLIVIQKVFHGENTNNYEIEDLTFIEMACFALMMIGLLWMGLYPQTMLDMAEPTLRSLGVAFP